MRSFMNSIASMLFMSARCLRKIQILCKVSLSNKRSSLRVPEDKISMLLDAVIDTIGETDYEMKSISGIVFIFSLSDRSFILSLAGLVIKTLNN